MSLSVEPDTFPSVTLSCAVFNHHFLVSALSMNSTIICAGTLPEPLCLLANFLGSFLAVVCKVKHNKMLLYYYSYSNLCQRWVLWVIQKETCIEHDFELQWWFLWITVMFLYLIIFYTINTSGLTLVISHFFTCSFPKGLTYRAKMCADL